MPLYQYKCDCGREEAVLLWGDTKVHCPDCRKPMERQFSQIAFVKNKGDGGYPSRQKFMRGSAPFMGKGKGVPVPWLDRKPELIRDNVDWCTGKEKG